MCVSGKNVIHKVVSWNTYVQIFAKHIRNMPTWCVRFITLVNYWKCTHPVLQNNAFTCFHLHTFCLLEGMWFIFWGGGNVCMMSCNTHRARAFMVCVCVSVFRRTCHHKSVPWNANHFAEPVLHVLTWRWLGVRSHDHALNVYARCFAERAKRAKLQKCRRHRT